MLRAPLIYGSVLIALGLGGFGMAWVGGGWRDPAAYGALVPAGFGAVAIVFGLLARVAVLQRTMLILVGVLALLALWGTAEGVLTLFGGGPTEGIDPEERMLISRAQGAARSMAVMALASMAQFLWTIRWFARGAPVASTGREISFSFKRTGVVLVGLGMLGFGLSQQRSARFADSLAEVIPAVHVVMLAKSEDLTTWTLDTTPVISPGDIPDLIRVENRTLLYAFDGDRSRLLVTDLSEGSGRSRPVVISPASACALEAGKACLDPAAVVLDDGSIRLYFVAADRYGDPALDGETMILSALSRDGVNFEVEPGVRLSGTGRTDPDPVRLPDGRYRMYTSRFASTEGEDGSGVIVESAFSADGLSFEEEEGIRLRGASATRTVLLSDGYWHAYHDIDSQLRVALSKDGLALTESPQPVFDPSVFQGTRFMGTEAPGVVQNADGTWTMALSVIEEPFWPLNELVLRRDWTE